MKKDGNFVKLQIIRGQMASALIVFLYFLKTEKLSYFSEIQSKMILHKWEKGKKSLKIKM